MVGYRATLSYSMCIYIYIIIYHISISISIYIIYICIYVSPLFTDEITWNHHFHRPSSLLGCRGSPNPTRISVKNHLCSVDFQALAIEVQRDEILSLQLSVSSFNAFNEYSYSLKRKVIIHLSIIMIIIIIVVFLCLFYCLFDCVSLLVCLLIWLLICSFISLLLL